MGHPRQWKLQSSSEMGAHRGKAAYLGVVKAGCQALRGSLLEESTEGLVCLCECTELC